MEGTPKIGEIYMMEFDGSDHEQSGKRPGIVFQNNVGNINSPNIIAIPLTTSLKKQNMPSHVVIKADHANLHRDSMALCESPVCISKSKIGFFISELTENDMKRIACASLLATSMIAFLDADELLNTWKSCRKLNKIS